MIIYHIVAIITSIVWPYSFCSFAASATKRISNVSYTAYDRKCFDLPVKLQKYVILIIGRSKEAVQFTGFGLLDCTLEIFLKVSILLSEVIFNKYGTMKLEIFKYILH